MSVSKELNKTTQQKVEALLRENPRYRESDRALIVRVWSDAAGGANKTKDVNLYDFLVDYLHPDSKYLSTESVGRARRLLQEKHPELRGANYVTRQVDEQAAVQVQLGYEITPPTAGGQTP